MSIKSRKKELQELVKQADQTTSVKKTASAKEIADKELADYLNSIKIEWLHEDAEDE